MTQREQRIKDFGKWVKNFRRGLERKKEGLDLLGKQITSEYSGIAPLAVIDYNGAPKIVSVPRLLNIQKEHYEAYLEKNIKKQAKAVAQENVKDLVKLCEIEDFKKLHRTSEITPLSRTILVYHAAAQAESRDLSAQVLHSYTLLLIEYETKILAAKPSDVLESLNKLSSLGYLEETDLFHLGLRFLNTREEGEVKDPTIPKTNGVKKRTSSVPPAILYPTDKREETKEEISVSSYNMSLLNAVLIDGLRLNTSGFIGGRYIPDRHLISNARRRNSGLDQDLLYETIDRLKREGVIVRDGSLGMKVLFL